MSKHHSTTRSFFEEGSNSDGDLRTQPWRAFWPPKNEPTHEEKMLKPWLVWEPDPLRPFEKPWRQWMRYQYPEILRDIMDHSKSS
jgi:hypothetical protein